MKKLLLILIALFVFTISYSQEQSGYMEPPKEIQDLILADPIPLVKESPCNDRIAVLRYTDIPSISYMAQKAYHLAGIRVLEATNSQRFKTKIHSVEIKAVNNPDSKSKRNANIKEGVVNGFPSEAKIVEVSWSPDGGKMAALVESEDGVRIWIIDAISLTAKKLSDKRLNLFFGARMYAWSPDSKSIMAAFVLENQRQMPNPNDYIEPVVYFNNGAKKPLRTFQDLLTDKYSEILFDYFATSNLGVVSIETGHVDFNWSPDIYTRMTYSPNGKYIFTQKITKPYSYLVPYSNFPTKSEILSLESGKVIEITSSTLSESSDRGPRSKRGYAWRPDKPATMYWMESVKKKKSDKDSLGRNSDTSLQNSGNKPAEKKIKDKIMEFDYPFKDGKLVIAMENNISDIVWGDENNAFIFTKDSIDNELMDVCVRISPKEGKEMNTVYSYKGGDIYTAKGNIVTMRNGLGMQVAYTQDNYKTIYFQGEGYSDRGAYPFVDRYDLKNKKVVRVWQSEDPYFEKPKMYLDMALGLMVTQRESQTDVPNYYLRNFKKKNIRQITFFEDPYPSMQGVSKQYIEYYRKDSVKLGGTLYLPVGYKKEDGPLPLLLWAYPADFKSKESAEKRKDSPNQFTKYTKTSCLLYLTKGYAILNNASFPIIDAKNPNDKYVEQLVANAATAIDKVVEMGVADRDKIAVSGHSYGGFMTANLLANCNLFAAGIARSGAYNRTLTPFGFQSERRNMWKASQVYLDMSPFMKADKFNTPILLIHGIADDNSGTFPIQSERLYAALKGNGAIVKLVMLPHEAHSYAAKESLLQQAYETYTWMEKYVKNRNKQEENKKAENR